MDRPALRDLDLLTGLGIEHLADDVEDLALRDIAHGHRDRLTRVAHLLAADETVGRLERDGADEVVTEVLRDLEGQRRGLLADRDVGLEGVVDARDSVVGKLDVDDGARDAGDAADAVHGGVPGGLLLGCGSHELSFSKKRSVSVGRRARGASTWPS